MNEVTPQRILTKPKGVASRISKGVILSLGSLMNGFPESGGGPPAFNALLLEDVL